MAANTPIQLDFVIVGAAKSATGWLANCLASHPQVYLPRQEIHYFSWHHEQHDFAWYNAHFADRTEGQVVGERSNTYLADPQVPARLAAAMPGTKLVMILRHPVERAYSDYCMHLRRRTATPDVARYLDPDVADCSRFIDNGLYGKQIASFAEHFPTEQMHIILQDDVKQNPEAVFAGVCRFLGVDATFKPELLGGTYHSKAAPLVHPVLNRLAVRLFRPETIENLRRGDWYRRWIRPILTRRTAYPELPPAVRAKLTDYYRSDVQGLSQLLGRDLNHWLE